MISNNSLLAAIGVGFSFLLMLLAIEWFRCRSELGLLKKLDSLKNSAEDLHEAWRHHNETVMCYLKLWDKIDSAHRASGESYYQEHVLKPPIPAPVTPPSTGILDSILGTNSSRRTDAPLAAPHAIDELPEIWIDHTKRDARGKALWLYYYEIPSVPAVLELSFNLKQGGRREQPRTIEIFIELFFSSIDNLDYLKSRRSGEVCLHAWRKVLHLQCEHKDAEAKAAASAKTWALSALNREVEVTDGTATTDQYERALKQRAVYRNWLLSVTQEIQSIEAKLSTF